MFVTQSGKNGWTDLDVIWHSDSLWYGLLRRYLPGKVCYGSSKIKGGTNKDMMKIIGELGK